MAVALSGDLCERLVERPAALVRALGHQRIEDVADSRDPSGERDLLAREPSRIAASVPVFVVMANSWNKRRTISKSVVKPYPM